MTSSPLRVLVVDDSAYNRRAIATLLEQIDGVQVVGKAADGNEALKLTAQLEPDLITLDLEMPRMDGFTFLRLLMARRPTPVIVVSGYSAKENVFRALELGAVDFVSKPAASMASDLSSVGVELRDKVSLVRQLSRVGLIGARGQGTRISAFPPPVEAEAKSRRAVAAGAVDNLIVIGASTGGPTALIEVFRKIPPQLSASILVAQHMPERFTRTFAERLDRLGRFRVEEARERTRLTPRLALICPGGRCLDVRPSEPSWDAVVVTPSADDRYIPSIDRLFRSAAAAAGKRVIGVVLTGMGSDGAKGVLAIKEAGGRVIAESAETAVIYGMPGAAVKSGAVDLELPIGEIGECLGRWVEEGR